MKKLNNKGFTLIEILAAVTILAILTILAISAFVSYLDWSRKKAFDTMAKSASTAAEQYIMDYPHAAVDSEVAKTEEGYEYGITFEELVSTGYLSNVDDPMGDTNCQGRVVVGVIEADEDNKRALDKYMFVVHECCMAYQARYVYSYELKSFYEKNDFGEMVLEERLTPTEEVSKSDVICR